MDPYGSVDFICLLCNSEGRKWIGLDGHLKTQTYLEALENLM